MTTATVTISGIWTATSAGAEISVQVSYADAFDGTRFEQITTFGLTFPAGTKPKTINQKVVLEAKNRLVTQNSNLVLDEGDFYIYGAIS